MPRGWWLHVVLVVAPVSVAAMLDGPEAQIDVAVAWLAYNTLATAFWAKRRREVDGWVLAHSGLVLAGLAVMGLLVHPTR